MSTSYGIRVIHGGRLKWFSWSANGICAVTPFEAAAARFPSRQAAQAAQHENPPLRAAGVVASINPFGLEDGDD